MADKTMTLGERVLLTIAPGFASRRVQAQRNYHSHKMALDVMRKYEAAGTGRRNDGWHRPGSSANAEVSTSAGMLRRGARQLVRDNGHAANAVNVLETNVIGTGIRPDFEAERDQTSRILEELWQEHVESESSGADEVGNFYDRQGLGFRAIVESGSVLSRRRRRDSRSNMPLPYQVQLLEPDFLDTTLSRHNGNVVIQGKEFDKRGALVAFHIYTQHPGDSFLGINTRTGSIRVLAGEISHAFRMDRPGQVDGVSWFAPVMTTLRDLGDTRDSYQLRQKIASCYAVFLHEPEPTGGISSNNTPVTSHVEPGRIESVPPGKDVTFASPPGVDGMSDFDKAQLMTIAVGMGMPYEALTGDLRNVSFLSGRMGWLAFYRNIDSWRSRIVIPRLCRPELNWFLDAARVSAGIAEPVRVHWISPHRDLLNPSEEIKALREEMRLGALSYPDMVKMRGRDPNQVLASWERWAKELEKRDLYFDWDPTRVSLSGNPNTNAAQESSDAPSSQN
jgi:lambda family phage portal protein